MATIALIGYGNMGAALHQSWLNTPHIFHITSPNILSKDTPAGKNNHYHPQIGDWIKDCDQIWLCVKPQIMNNICESIKPYTAPETLLISIAAGQPISNFETLFGADQPIIRVMPNTPVAIGKGTILLTANSSASATHRKDIEILCNAAGRSYWLDSEDQMDAAQAIAGSGPAYLFYFIETLTEAGIQSGLPKQLAETLARDTVIGSSALAEISEQSPAALREAVTSKGGVTAAALKHMMDGTWQDIMNKAIAANIKRSKELG